MTVAPTFEVPNSLQGLRVLLVEDDGDFREVMNEILQDTGATVQCEASAAQAFAAMRTFRPQLLVSDIAMPGEDGYSLMRRIRALDPTSGGQIPAIAVTAFSRPDDQKEALAAGFTALLGKPLDLPHLMLTLNQLSPFALSRGR